LRLLSSGTGSKIQGGVPMMPPLLILWVGLTVVLIGLLSYRSTLAMHEDDQLFLDNAEAHMAREQEELIVRMNRIQPWHNICGAGSAALFILIVGMKLYASFNQ